PRRSSVPADERVRPIRFLREYSNYLTPRLGLFGADTWTMIAVWLRNVILNQFVLVSFLAAVLVVPRMFGRLTDVSGVLLVLAAVSLFNYGCSETGWNLRRIGEPPATPGDPVGPGFSQGEVQFRIVLPMFASAAATAAFLVQSLATRAVPDWVLAVVAFVV